MDDAHLGEEAENVRHRYDEGLELSTAVLLKKVVEERFVQH